LSVSDHQKKAKVKSNADRAVFVRAVMANLAEKADAPGYTRSMKAAKNRVGIYAGTFDPVHAGHMTFALQAMERAGLDELHFLPERRPRFKQGIEHFGHRVAMLRQAVKPHPRFKIIELDDVSFNVERTLPALRKRFPQAQLVFLFGSDAIEQLADWPLSERLLEDNELVVGIRSSDRISGIQAAIRRWKVQPKAVRVFNSFAPEVSSRKVREALRTQQHTAGALTSVKRYSDQNWLYVSLSSKLYTP
jgi:nicotinate-nucleotide adenylyltransferase